MNKRNKVCIACFLGGSLGVLLALELPRFFWWVGLLIGGGIGYCSYRVDDIRRAVQRIWQEIRWEDVIPCAGRMLLNIGRKVLLFLLFVLLCGVTVFAAYMDAFSVTMWVSVLFSTDFVIQSKGADTYFVWVGGTGAAFVAFIFLHLVSDNEDEAKRNTWILLLSPGVLPFTALAATGFAAYTSIRFALRCAGVAPEYTRRVLLILVRWLKLKSKQ